MKVCCSSRASICFWLIASLGAWTVLATIGMFWHPLHATSAVTCLLAVAVGCLANAFRNRTYHCILAGPLNSVTLVRLDARHASFGLDSRSCWDRNCVLPGVALFPQAISDHWLQFLRARRRRLPLSRCIESAQAYLTHARDSRRYAWRGMAPASRSTAPQNINVSAT
jgi:hypothetical protein